MNRFMPNLTLFDATAFFPAQPKGAYRVTENLAFALREAAAEADHAGRFAEYLAERVIAVGNAWMVPIPMYPQATLILFNLPGVSDPTPLPLLMSRRADESHQLIFGVRSDACP